MADATINVTITQDPQILATITQTSIAATIDKAGPPGSAGATGATGPPGAAGGTLSDGDKGDITVSASGATWTVDAGAITLAKTADMATASVLYRKTAGTGVPEVNTLATLKTDLGLTGTNSGDQTIPTVSDTAYDATSWNTNTDAPTKNAVRDKIETMDTSIATNTAKVTYPSADATKVGHITVTQAVDIDTIESDTATNNAKISFDSTSSTRLANTSGTNTGDNATNTQYSGLVTNATHTGDATGSTALTIAANAVTNAKAAQMATKTYKGRTTAATGNSEDVAVATLKTDLVLVKADVGLGNVDNTSNATERAATATLSGKRIDQRIVSAASYTTNTGSSLDVSTTDVFVITAQAGALLFNSPGGTPLQGQKIIIRIKDNGTARALTWNTVFRGIVPLPSITIISKTLYLGFMYNSTDTTFDLIALAQE